MISNNRGGLTNPIPKQGKLPSDELGLIRLVSTMKVDTLNCARDHAPSDRVFTAPAVFGDGRVD
jgi:hypothetical protein